MITVTQEYRKAKVILFRDSGKYSTEEYWEIPDDATGPWSMEKSVDFHRIGHGAVLVPAREPPWVFSYLPTQEPWGFPYLINAEPNIETRHGW